MPKYAERAEICKNTLAIVSMFILQCCEIDDVSRLDEAVTRFKEAEQYCPDNSLLVEAAGTRYGLPISHEVNLQIVKLAYKLVELGGYDAALSWYSYDGRYGSVYLLFSLQESPGCICEIALVRHGAHEMPDISFTKLPNA